MCGEGGYPIIRKTLLVPTAMCAIFGIVQPTHGQSGNPCTRPGFVASVMESMNATNQYRRAGLSIVDINNIKWISNNGIILVCHGDFTTSDGVIRPARFILHLNKTSDTAYIEISPDE